MRKISLTEREGQVLEQLSHGKTSQEIAESLYLSPHTVETHRKNIILKMNASNSAHLVRIAFEQGILSATESRGRVIAIIGETSLPGRASNH